MRRRERDEDLEAEIATHLEYSMEEYLRQGMSVEEARRRALVELGGIEQAKELHRDSRGLPFLDTLFQDTRHGLRTLRRDAGLALFAVLVTGLGVGASSTVFNVVNALMLRPLPFDDPERLVWIANDLGEGMSAQTVQVSNLLEFRSQNQSFSDVAAYFAFYGVGDSKLTGTGEPERLTNVPVSENFFPLLGVKPVLGRQFSADECKWNGPRAVLLTHGFWVRRFASDGGIVGRPLTLNGNPVTVVGVLPASFDFGAVFAPGTHVDLFSPFPLTKETNRWGNTLGLVGRLKPGVGLGAAQAEAAVLGKHISDSDRNRNALRPALTMLHEHVSGSFRSTMVLLVCAVGMVMLIVCANLSNLLLARSATRQKEMAIRAALGAGRGRLIRQMLTESLMLATCGAALGLLMATAATRVLVRFDAISIPLLSQVRVDGPALGFALLIAVATGIAFGLMPALRVSSLSLHDTLKESSRGSTEGQSHGWIRRTLVVCEIAFACMLLAGAGLLIRSLTRVLHVNLGFEPQSAAAVRIDPNSGYSTQTRRNSYFDEALRRVRSTPGIHGAGLTDALPLGRNRSWGLAPKGRTFTRDNYPEAYVRIISDGYFQAMGIAMVEGRDFAPTDTPESEPVIIVNETLAKRMWPGESAVGKLMQTDRPERRVVGVVRDVRHLALEKDAGMEMYLPMRQTNDYSMVDLVVRGIHTPAGLAAAVRSALIPLDPTLPANEFRSIQGLVDKSVSPRRFLVVLLAGFAGFALILAALGIYGVISYSVNQRQQEIGIRMALGASAGDVQRSVLMQTIRLAAVGMALGLVASWVLGRLIRGLLYDVGASDPVAFGAMLVALGLVASLAGYLPARRASKLDPVVALRAE